MEAENVACLAVRFWFRIIYVNIAFYVNAAFRPGYALSFRKAAFLPAEPLGHPVDMVVIQCHCIADETVRRCAVQHLVPDSRYGVEKVVPGEAELRTAVFEGG